MTGQEADRDDKDQRDWATLPTADFAQQAKDIEGVTQDSLEKLATCIKVGGKSYSGAIPRSKQQLIEIMIAFAQETSEQVGVPSTPRWRRSPLWVATGGYLLSGCIAGLRAQIRGNGWPLSAPEFLRFRRTFTYKWL
jgi:hypothetical protein